MSPDESGSQRTHVHAHRPVLDVYVRRARFRDLLAVLHPEALLVDAVHAGQVALQHEDVAFDGKHGVLGGADHRLCRGDTNQAPVK